MESKHTPGPRITIECQTREGRRTKQGYRILTIIVLSDGTKFQGTTAEAERFLAEHGMVEVQS